jgi:hypothetical protein
VKGYPWVKAPPGFVAGTEPQPALQN